MKRISHAGLRLSAAALFSGAVLTGCVTGPPRGAVFVRTAPPRAIIEVRGTAPGPDLVWISGYHAWRGGDYVWVPGRWERAPRARAVWVAGQWKHRRDGWYWVDGRWK